MRSDVCASDDYATRDRLFEALAAIGASGVGDGDEFGVGLHRFSVGAEALTVFVDAWTVDLEGPDQLVQRVLELISAGGHG
jgi:hypothetical protein